MKKSTVNLSNYRSTQKCILLLVFFLFAHVTTTYAQAPAIEWQNTIGGSNEDFLQSIQQTTDGGYILGGDSKSNISGDKTENCKGVADYWVLKLDSSGYIEWQNTIGGSGDERLQTIEQTTDGGYIIGGYSLSNISGDKTEICNGGYDYWVIKLDDAGNIEWQNTIGGAAADYLTSLSQTIDGGYILGGYSTSNISGDKTESSYGDNDYWVIKLDDTGVLEWQKTIGGSSGDYLLSINQTVDGGYILGGWSASGISGNKTENSNGLEDYWVIKLNSSGDIEWQNAIGGSNSDYLYSIQQTTDNGFILGGYSWSNISGDKTENRVGLTDYWVVKLNAIGGIEWQNNIGGNANDELRFVQQTADSGYILGGFSLSNISGDKTENSNGDYDYWVLKLDPAGGIEWQNTIGGSGYDKLVTIEQTTDDGYMLGGYSLSNISGDKTEICYGNYDIWVIKLEGSVCTPTTETCNTLDDDCDGLIDEGTLPTINISAGGATTFCQGSNVLLTASHTGTGLQWKRNGVIVTGATGITYTATIAGSYTCESTNACGITISAPISVTVNKNPTATITAGGPTTFCAGGSVVLTANAGGGLSYQWYKGATAIPGATTISYTATTSGSYKCRVTKNATGCFKNSNAIVVSVICKEGEEGTIATTLNAYPNPATTELYITCSADINTAQLYNELGQLIMEISVSDGYAQADISALSAGMYILRAGGEVVQWVKQ